MMDKMNHFIEKHPAWFGLAASVVHILMVIAAAILGALVPGETYGPMIGGMVARLAFIALLLALLTRLGWLRAAGFRSPAQWQVWFLLLLPLAYTIVVSTYAITGNINLRLAEPIQGLMVIAFISIAATLEEVVFRGLILHSLTRAWGINQRSLVKSVWVSALFFGAMHLADALGGRPFTNVFLQAVQAVFLGIFLAVVVLKTESIYPSVVFHATLNVAAFLNQPSLTWEPEAASWLFLDVLMLPLAIFGLYWLRRGKTPAATQSKSTPGSWIKRVLLGVGYFILSLALLGAGYQALATALDDRYHPAPGQMVDVGGYKLHLYCTGSGSPTVVLDALFPGTVSNWAWVQPEIARSTKVCAYDRAGLGWSERGPVPRDAHQQAEELHTLLSKAGIPGPYVLVGHSLGGLSVRMFADHYPDEVAGMVLIEATNPDSWRRLGIPEGIGADQRQLAIGTFLARFGLFRLGLLSAYTLDTDLPIQQQNEQKAFFNSVKSLETVQDVNNAFSAALEQVRHAGDLNSIPLAVILGSKGDGGNPKLSDLFAQQGALSSNSATMIIDGATHAGLVDNQIFALQTSSLIRQVIEAVRNDQALVSGSP